MIRKRFVFFYALSLYSLISLVLTSAQFFAAGTLKIPYRTFFAFNGLAAAIELPLLVYGVRFVGGRWQEIMATIERFQVALLIGLAAVALLALAMRARRRRSRPGASRIDESPPQ